MSVWDRSTDKILEIAWSIYCDETKYDMDTADFFHELPSRVQTIYIEKATKEYWSDPS